MTGFPEFNAPAFHLAHTALMAAGYRVIIPGVDEEYSEAELAALAASPANRKKWLRKDIEDILTVDEVWVLPGWEYSRGALLEVHVAQQLGLPVFLFGTGLRVEDTVQGYVEGAAETVAG